MAVYKYSSYLHQSQSSAYDTIYSPGNETPYSGIYRCEGCGGEVASNQGNPLPPQNSHQHPANKGPVKWKLIVYAQTNP